MRTFYLIISIYLEDILGLLSKLSFMAEIGFHNKQILTCEMLFLAVWLLGFSDWSNRKQHKSLASLSQSAVELCEIRV